MRMSCRTRWPLNLEFLLLSVLWMETKSGALQIFNLQFDSKSLISSNRKLLDPNNYEKVVDLLNENVTDDDKKGLPFILGELVFIYSVVASQDPRKTFCLAEFAERAEGLQIFLARKYPWFNLGSYLHIACSHTLEILESQESIGKS